VRQPNRPLTRHARREESCGAVYLAFVEQVAGQVHLGDDRKMAVVDGETYLYSENFACPEHGVSLPELEPRIFSFNTPHGACPRCTGLGSQLEIDPDLLVPDPSLSLEEGALVPWSLGGQGFYESVIKALADRYEIDLTTPWRELDREEQDRFLHGTGGDRILVTYRNRMGRKRQYTMAFEGLVANLQRRYRETDSSQQRERIEEYMSMRPCPVCHGARLKPEVLAVTVGGDDFLAGTGIPFDPTEWQEGHRLSEWTVMTVTETSVRFRRNEVFLNEPPSSEPPTK
jgi:excinuclease ABC subunit A